MNGLLKEAVWPFGASQPPTPKPTPMPVPLPGVDPPSAAVTGVFNTMTPVAGRFASPSTDPQHAVAKNYQREYADNVPRALRHAIEPMQLEGRPPLPKADVYPLFNRVVRMNNADVLSQHIHSGRGSDMRTQASEVMRNHGYRPPYNYTTLKPSGTAGSWPWSSSSPYPAYNREQATGLERLQKATGPYKFPSVGNTGRDAFNLLRDREDIGRPSMSLTGDSNMYNPVTSAAHELEHARQRHIFDGVPADSRQYVSREWLGFDSPQGFLQAKVDGLPLPTAYTPAKAGWNPRLPPNDFNVPAELPATIGDLGNMAEDFSAQTGRTLHTAVPLGDRAAWLNPEQIRRQMREHGYPQRSMTELLTSRPGMAWLDKKLNQADASYDDAPINWHDSKMFRENATDNSLFPQARANLERVLLQDAPQQKRPVREFLNRAFPQH